MLKTVTHITDAAAIIIIATIIFYSCHTEIEYGEIQCPSSEIIPEIYLTECTASESDTRSAVTGTKISSYGLFLCQHWNPASGDANPYKEYQKGTNNISATSTSYKLNGNSNSSPSLFIKKSEESSGFDVFAYAPYISAVTTPESIPFTLEGQDDIMWAVENSPTYPDQTNRSGIVPDGYDKVLQLHFRHALSLLKINLKLNCMPYTYPDNKSPSHLVSVGVKLADDAETQLYRNALIDAVNQTISPSGPMDNGTTYVHRYSSSSNLSFDASGSTLNLLLVPSPYAKDDDIELIFTIDNVEMPVTYLVKRNDLKHADGSTFGFQSGYEYSFNFVFDNYLHLDGVSVSHEWKDNEPTEITI